MSGTAWGATFENVLWLIESGCGTDEVIARTGLRPDSIARSLHRHGRTDLAREYFRLGWHNRPSP